MRGSVAKRLRREAREATVGLPLRAYVGREKVYNQPVTYRDNRGVLQKGTRRVTVTEVRLDPACTRAVYKNLKRHYKAA